MALNDHILDHCELIHQHNCITHTSLSIKGIPLLTYRKEQTQYFHVSMAFFFILHKYVNKILA